MRRVLNGLTYGGIGMIVIIVLIVSILLSIRWIKAEKLKITTPNGIQEKRYINLGGIEQYVQIRGEDRDNPVIVFLHGGPGNTISHLAYQYQTDLESQYTFVNWDQRGSGRTYYKNLNLNVQSQLSTKILLNDLDELIDYIRDELNQEQVIIMGHSWGTLLGSQYALAHPDKVLAYVGIGQVVSLKEGYVYSANKAIEKAQEQGDNKMAEQLEVTKNIFSNTNTLEVFDFNNFIKMQQATMRYNMYEGQMSNFKMVWMMITSPELSFEEIKWFFKTSNPTNLVALQGPLLSDCFFELNLNDFSSQYSMPVYYISGEYDVSTPIELVEEYYNSIEAPTKSIIRMPNTGHLPFFDDPQGFSEVIKILFQ
ncbi:MAG: alpha/beta fold hydrolase [Cellulosilyticaceae bacterium]